MSYKQNIYHHRLVPVSWASDTNTLKATNLQRSTWQNSMSFSSGAVRSTLRDKLKLFLDSEPDLEKILNQTVS